MLLFRLLAVLILALIIGHPAGAQQSRWASTDSCGGEGGGPFEQACPGDSYMIGISAKAGAWVNAVSPVCAIWEPGNNTLAEIPEQPWHGQTSGGTTFIRCAPPYGVFVGMDTQGAHDKGHLVVGLINVYCGNIQNPGQHVNKLGGSVDDLGNTAAEAGKFLSCPRGFVATGLYRRNGVFIDKIGCIACCRQ